MSVLKNQKSDFNNDNKKDDVEVGKHRQDKADLKKVLKIFRL